ncbi:MAG: LysM peptidoglycan-binding domain-containing protein [Planctomycetes bacterium]|nr:LysM peptidoglycan-binding domain-containing protein [Planctomycetota bacterium]
MGELEKYGLLSLASILVLFLVLTFVRRDLPAGAIRYAALADEPDVLVVEGASAGTQVRAGEPAAAPPAEPEHEVATAQPEGASDAAAGAKVYVVRRGDTLSGIAQQHLGSARRWPELLALNGPLDPKKLRIGQQILLPPADQGRTRRAAAPQAEEEDAAPRPAEPPRRETKKAKKPERPRPSASSHRIEPGDTLSAIALKYYGDAMQWKRIHEENRDRIRDARHLEPGTVLRLP